MASGHNIVESFEAKELRKRPLAIKLADTFTSRFGGLGFLALNLLFFGAWIYINLGRVPQIVPFDPFPFILLTMIVSLEAIFLSIIVLMSQNRQSYISSLREEIDMQVNLIAEREITKSLKLLKEIKEGLLKNQKRDEELEEMIKKVNTSYIERQLAKQLSEKPVPFIKRVTSTFSRASRSPKSEDRS